MPERDLVAAAGLTPEEYAQVRAIIGREPNALETYLFGVMWSEHCSYKSSRIHLKTLPTKGEMVLVGPGENAGVIDAGDGLAVVFKIESHNHPSFIEPYQGAATGVGGILRDIFTMGARPIMLMDSLRFGDPTLPKTRYLVRGVVAGIGGYGNCIGVPTVGGETSFHPSYNGNPLVNAFCLGVAEKEGIFLANATGVGNPVVYVGSKTGKDGIHGAVMASETFDDGAEERRPTVQVGDPFTEKLLLEACLEAMQSGALVGIQDMGAAGLTCSTCEMASRGGAGLLVDLDRVPLRETGMTPVEIMLSESQERMLLVLQKGKEREVLSIFERWDLEAVVIGTVTDTGNLTLRWHGETIADVPARPLADDAPLLDRPRREPTDLASRRVMPEFPEVKDWNAFAGDFLCSPNMAEKAWVWEQYDHMVRTGTVILPGGDAALIRLPGSDRGVAAALDGNQLACHVDPRRGASLTVAEAARNVACVGAVPVAVTNCLNFGDPTDPETMWTFAEAVAGLGDACRALKTPVTGGNVSLYNQTKGTPVLPTPVIGMVGLIDDVAKRLTHGFPVPGHLLVIAGRPSWSLAASQALLFATGEVAGLPPEVDWELERSLHRFLAEAARRGIVASAHDIGDGGLLTALTESAFGGRKGHPVGFAASLSGFPSAAAALLGEGPSTVLLGVLPDDLTAVVTLAADLRVPIFRIGETTAGHHGRISVEASDGEVAVDLDLPALEARWRAALRILVEGE
jgi:phosphoribosylformylglycinamidine synthase